MAVSVTPPSASGGTTTDLRVLPGPAPQKPAAPVPIQPPHTRRHRRRWLLVASAALLAAAAAGQVWRASRAPAQVHYVTARVVRGSITRAVTASGSLNPVTTIQVGTYVSGVIEKLYCDYNTVVRKGQLCAKIDARPYQTVVDQDRANLSTAKAQLVKDQTNLAYAKLSFGRASDLRVRGIVSQDTLDAARSTFDQAAAQIEVDKATVEQHEAALKAAVINLGYTDIVSPVDGTVVSRNVTMGQTVAASFQTPTLFLIATDLAQMQVDANVSESDIGGVGVGNAATFTVEAFPNRVFDGAVVQVRQAPQTVQNVVTYDVVIGVANPGFLLKPGMTATVRIIVDKRSDVLRLPDQALRYAPGPVSAAGGAPTRVWILRDGRPVAVPITLGLDDDTYSEVVQGELRAGDEVITGEQTTSGSTSNRPPFFRL